MHPIIVPFGPKLPYLNYILSFIEIGDKDMSRFFAIFLKGFFVKIEKNVKKISLEFDETRWIG